jgi:hypothetical protein
MMMKNLVEWRLAGETEVLGENLPTNPTWPDPGLNPGRHGGKSTTNHLRYGAATRSSTSSLRYKYAQVYPNILRYETG